jgi:hypothetical protein
VTVAFPVRDVTYSTDALRGRIDDLTRALEIGMGVVVSSSTWSLDGGTRIIVAERVRRLIADIDQIRQALLDVCGTVQPSEEQRTASLGVALAAVAPTVMSGPLALAYSAWTGHLWPSLRLVADTAIAVIPHEPARDHLITVSGMPATPTAPPRTLKDRVSRIPSGDEHIRIERFTTDGGNRFEVYLSGTNFLGDETDPWNVTSNIELAATRSSASLQAVRSAMESAGITRSTPVVMTGHSQGGLIALALAGTREFDVDAVITVGTPVGVVPDLPDTPTIHLIHPNDPVPALGGFVEPSSNTWIVPEEHGERLFAAHHRQSYLPSAATVDDVADPRIVALLTSVQSDGIGFGRDYRAVTTGVQHPGTDAK